MAPSGPRAGSYHPAINTAVAQGAPSTAALQPGSAAPPATDSPPLQRASPAAAPGAAGPADTAAGAAGPAGTAADGPMASKEAALFVCLARCLWHCECFRDQVGRVSGRDGQS